MDATSTPGGNLLDATAPLDRERIFRGELLVFRQLPAMLRLVARGRALAAAAFAPHPPPAAQAALAPACSWTARPSCAARSCATGKRPPRCGR